MSYLVTIQHQVMSELARNFKEMTMDNVTFIEVETLNGTETHAIIDRGNGEFTSMLKSTYDQQKAALIADE